MSVPLPIITRRLQFCMGHRIVNHESKCCHFHGHNYVVYLHARSKDGIRLDSLGRVVDFSVLKKYVGGWIEDNWDHGMTMWSQDPYAPLWIGVSDTLNLPGNDNGKYFLLNDNPTAENLASYLLHEVCPSVIPAKYNIEVFKVILHETENCSATAQLEE